MGFLAEVFVASEHSSLTLKLALASQPSVPVGIWLCKCQWMPKLSQCFYVRAKYAEMFFQIASWLLVANSCKPYDVLIYADLW